MILHDYELDAPTVAPPAHPATDSVTFGHDSVIRLPPENRTDSDSPPNHRERDPDSVTRPPQPFKPSRPGSWYASNRRGGMTTWFDRTGFQRDLLHAIAVLEADDELPYGLALKEWLGERWIGRDRGRRRPDERVSADRRGPRRVRGSRRERGGDLGPRVRRCAAGPRRRGRWTMSDQDESEQLDDELRQAVEEQIESAARAVEEHIRRVTAEVDSEEETSK